MEKQGRTIHYSDRGSFFFSDQSPLEPIFAGVARARLRREKVLPTPLQLKEGPHL